MAKTITVSDLVDQTNTPYPRPFLYCRKCEQTYSAQAGHDNTSTLPL